MLKCPSCNKTYDDDFDFCPYCGKASDNKKCPTCGFKSNEFNFCPKCGIELLTETEMNQIQAKEYYKEAIKLEVNDEYEKAMKYYDKATELDSNDTNEEKLDELKKLNKQKEKQNHYQEAIELEKQGWYKEAIEYCKKAINLDPDNPKNKEKLEELREKLKAEESYQEAIELEKQGKYAEARKYCRKAITLDPNNPKYKEKLEKLQGKYTETIKNLNTKKKLAQNQSDKNKYHVTEALQKLEKLQAEDHYKKAIKFEEQKQYKTSIECINKAMKLNPNNTKYQDKFKELKRKI